MNNQSQNGIRPYDELDQSESPLPLGVLLRLLRGRWHWAILAGLLLGCGLGFLGYNAQREMYKGISTVDLKLSPSIAVDYQDMTFNTPYRNFVMAELRALQSREVIEAALSQAEMLEAIAQRPAGLPEVTVDSFASNLTVTEPLKFDSVLTVEFVDAHADTARAGVNALLESYRVAKRRDQTEYIDENLDLLQNQLRNYEKEKSQAQSQISLVIAGEEVLMVDARLKAKLSELSLMEAQLSEVDLTLKPYLDALSKPDANSELLAVDPEMQPLLEEQTALQQSYDYLTEVLGRGEQMPDVVQVRRALTMVKRKIAQLEQQRLATLGQRDQNVMPLLAAELMAKREVIVQKIDQLNAETSDLGSRIAAVQDYQAKLETLRDNIAETKKTISQYQTSLDISRKQEVSRIVIGMPSPTPTDPYNKKKRIQFAVLGGIAGGSIGFGLVMLVGLMDRRIRHASDTIEGMPEANVLGVLPTLPANLTDPEDAETVAHCVHHIRTLLQIGGNRVFSITSPAAGSGKSSLATALGMSFAASGVRTLVIDCDLVGAGLTRRMGTVVHEPLGTVVRRNEMLDEASLANAVTHATAHNQPLDQVLLEKGLLDQDQLDSAIRLQRDSSLGLLDACVPNRLRDCVASTDVSGLFILPIGRSRPGDASRLSPAAVRTLVAQAREEYDIVLIDTGPVLGSIEASIVSAEADATVVIVSRGDHKGVTQRMIDQLRSVRANIVGFVFNHALNSDIQHSSYVSMVSQERRADLKTKPRLTHLDKSRSGRLGPLGVAVATYSEDEFSEADASHATMNGSGTPNGHS